IVEADARQYRILLLRVKEQREGVLPVLHKELAKTAPNKANDPERDALAERQARAAVTLLHLGEPGPVWPLLVWSPDPSRRTWLLHFLAAYGIEIGTVTNRLGQETDLSVRRALILALGKYSIDRLPATEREPLVARLLEDYRRHPDAGYHGAVEWLLR